MNMAMMTDTVNSTLPGILEGFDDIVEGTLSTIGGVRASMDRGITPNEVVSKWGNVQLRCFGTPSTPAEGRAPLLIVPSLINRWYVLDLLESTSFIKDFSSGTECFLIDWGYPGAESGHLPMSHFYHRCIRRAVRKVKLLTGASKVDLLGYCIGGTMAYAYSCLEPEDVRRMILLTAPIDFTDTGVLGLYAEDFPSSAFREAMDYMPGWLLSHSFSFVQPMGLPNKIKMFRKKYDDEKFKDLFVAMERWISDQVHYPIRAYDELLTNFYKENLLFRGALETDEKLRVQPSARTCQTLIVNATQDHIAPIPCTRLPLEDRAHVEESSFKTGHIGITVGRQGTEVRAKIRDFLGLGKAVSK